MPPFLQTAILPRTRVELMTHALQRAATALAEGGDGRFFREQTQFIQSALDVLPGDSALSINPKDVAHSLLHNRAAIQVLALHADTLARKAGMSDPEWRSLQDTSLVFRRIPLYNHPTRQSAVEDSLMYGADTLYGRAWGQITYGIHSLFMDAYEYAQEHDLEKDFTLPRRFIASFVSEKYNDNAISRDRLNRDGYVPGLGNTRFSNQTTSVIAVPSYYAPDYFMTAKYIVLAPVADGLKFCFGMEQARQLLANANSKVYLLTAVKGLNRDAQSALDYINATIQAARKETGSKKKIRVLDVLGYYPVKMVRLVREKIARGQSLTPEELASVELQLALACPDGEDARELAKELSVPHIVKRSFVTIEDPDAIRSNERASILKNLMGIDLGRRLFNEMLDVHENAENTLAQQLADIPIPDGDGESNPTYQEVRKKTVMSYFESLFERMQQEDEQAIWDVLSQDPKFKKLGKKMVIEQVRRDFYGSWTTRDFASLFALVGGVFRKDLDPAQRKRAMLKFKVEVGNAFTVRNILFGFSLAADRRSKLRGHYVPREEAEDLINQLFKEGILTAEQKKDMIDNLTTEVGYHYLSLIPDGVKAEGASIAQSIPQLYTEEELEAQPAPFKDTILFIEKIQSTIFLTPTMRRELQDLSSEIAHILPGSGRATDEELLRILSKLSQTLMTAQAMIENRSKTTDEEVNGAQARVSLILLFIHSVQEELVKLIGYVDGKIGMREEQVCYYLQEILEVMTWTNRLEVIPPSDELSQEITKVARKVHNLHSAPETQDEVKNLVGIEVLLQELRQFLIQEHAEDLIDLTYRMNNRLALKTVQRKDLNRVFERIMSTVESVSNYPALQANDISPSTIRRLKEQLAETMQSIERIEVLSADKKTFAYLALIELLVYSGRLLKDHPARMPTVFLELILRFSRISKFLMTENEKISPLQPL